MLSFLEIIQNCLTLLGQLEKISRMQMNQIFIKTQMLQSIPIISLFYCIIIASQREINIFDAYTNLFAECRLCSRCVRMFVVCHDCSGYIYIFKVLQSWSVSHLVSFLAMQVFPLAGSPTITMICGKNMKYKYENIEI